MKDLKYYTCIYDSDNIDCIFLKKVVVVAL